MVHLYTVCQVSDADSLIESASDYDDFVTLQLEAFCQIVHVRLNAAFLRVEEVR